MTVALVLLGAHFLLFSVQPSQIHPLLFLDRLYDVLLVSIIIFLGMAIGLWVNRLLSLPSGVPLEQLVLAAGTGLGILAYATLALALIGAIYPWTLILLLGLLALAAKAEWTHLARLLREIWASRQPLDSFQKVITLIIAVLALSSLLQALTPPTDYDGLMYHLTAPKTYLGEHRLVSFPHIPQANFPATAEMLYTIAMGLGSPMAAKLIHLSFAFLISVTVFSMARRFLNPKVAWLSLAVLWSIPIFVVEAGWAYIDLVWTFYEFLALYAFLLWIEYRNRRWLLLSGLFMGLALGTKYMAGYGLTLLAGAIAFQGWISNRQRPVELVRDLGLFAMLSGLVASPWYLKNWLYLGNPIYPLLFGGLNYGLHRVEASAYFPGNIGMGRCFRCYLLLIWNIYAHSQWFGSAPPESPSFLSLSLPLWVLWRKNRVVNWLLTLSLLRFILWAVTLQDLRYLLPIYPALSVATGYILHQAILHGRRRLPWDFFVRALVISMLLISLGLQLLRTLLTLGNPFPVILGLESADTYLRDGLNNYAVIQYVNDNLPEESRLLLIGEKRGYYLQREYIPDATNDMWWGYLMPLGGSQEGILTLLQHWGVSHILLSEVDVEWLLPWDREERIEQGMQLFFAFKERYLSEIYADQWGFHLYEVRLDEMPVSP